MKIIYISCYLGIMLMTSCGGRPANDDQTKTQQQAQNRAEAAATPIVGIDHVGINVPDIDSATVFLQRAFGAEFMYETHRKQDPPLDLTGIENTLNVAKGTKIFASRVIKLGYGPTIELFEVHANEQRSAIKSSDLGLQHICLYTNDIYKAVKQFVAAGGKILSEPVPNLFPEEKGKHNFFCYGLTPWGTSIEFITYPDKMKYEKQTPLRRWKGGISK